MGEVLRVRERSSKNVLDELNLVLNWKKEERLCSIRILQNDLDHSLFLQLKSQTRERRR